MKTTNLYMQALSLVRRPPCWNSTARHAGLDTSNVTWRAKWNLGFIAEVKTCV